MRSCGMCLVLQAALRVSGLELGGLFGSLIAGDTCFNLHRQACLVSPAVEVS